MYLVDHFRLWASNSSSSISNDATITAKVPLVTFSDCTRTFMTVIELGWSTDDVKNFEKRIMIEVPAFDMSASAVNIISPTWNCFDSFWNLVTREENELWLNSFQEKRIEVIAPGDKRRQKSPVG